MNKNQIDLPTYQYRILIEKRYSSLEKSNYYMKQLKIGRRNTTMFYVYAMNSTFFDSVLARDEMKMKIAHSYFLQFLSLFVIL